MKRILFLLACTPMLLASFFPATAQSRDQQTEVELRRMTQELLDAVAPGKREVWERYLDSSLVHLDENGVVRSKEELLRELSPLPPGLVGRIEVDTFRVRTHGDTAVTVYEIQEYLDYHGQPLRSRFRAVDTWRKMSDGWRLVGAHIAAVLKDPPATRLDRDTLCAYAGAYTLTPAIEVTIACEGDGLTATRAGRPVTRYLAEVRDVFFVAGQPRTRRIFTRDSAGRIDGFVDRREGEDIRWKRKVSAAAQR